jgi:hypothetical protein
MLYELMESLSNFVNGFQGVTVSGVKIIPMEELNSLFYRLDEIIKYNARKGLCLWGSGETYNINDIVYCLDNSNNPKYFKSLTNNNLGNNPLEDATNWVKIVLGGTGGGFVDSFQYGLRTDAPLGYLRCDGNEYLASSYVEFINQYLLTGKIPYISLEDYQAQLNNNDDNCACFGYDNPDSGGNGLILRVPD